MNCIRDQIMKCAALLGVGLVLLLAGCESNDPYGAVNPETPWTPGMAGGEAGPAGDFPSPDLAEPWSVSPPVGAILRAGDLVSINFSDVPNPPLPHEERIREDGNITLPLNVTVMAAGKSVGELREAIHKAYVPKYFNHLTVTVTTTERVYYVGGEVRTPSRQPYLGYMSVLRAIDTAGGFTEFAKRSRVQLRRANGELHTINYDKAMKDPKLDLEVYPGDRVTVMRRGL